MILNAIGAPFLMLRFFVGEVGVPCPRSPVASDQHPHTYNDVMYGLFQNAPS